MSYHPGLPLIGQRVIALTNEAVPPIVATLIGFDDLGKPDSHRLPVIVTDDNRQFVCMGILLPYTEELLAMVNALPPGRAWWAFRDAFWFRSDLNKAVEPIAAPAPQPTKAEPLWRSILRQTGLRG